LSVASEKGGTFRMRIIVLLSLLLAAMTDGGTLYTYTLSQQKPVEAYDEAVAVATLQGVINRQSPELYVLSPKNARPKFWLDLLSKDDRWLVGREQKRIGDLDGLVKLAGSRLQGAIIWDPAVPATVNVATTIAGVRDGIVLSPELAERYLGKWKLPVIQDLRARFKSKNEAYRWAIRGYLAKGLCLPHRLCLFEDAFTTRKKGDVGYAITRDWAVKSRAFVFDLSPWGDEKPGDDPNQNLGDDLETYKMILAETQRQAAGKEMTELTGFFAEEKYSHTATHPSCHEGVPTEWESVWLMTPYNVYQNTISSDCYNQSFHSQAPHATLKQNHPAITKSLEKKAYVCVLMADYDSSTPLYDFLPKFWASPDRGKIPLAWAVNPNQLENYPDVIAYFYSTATASDTFTADASAAGYVNPTHIAKDSLPLFTRHNEAFYREADMDISPEVLDQNPPTPEVKDAYAQFSPAGYATYIASVAGPQGTYPPPQVWKGMPIIALLNETCNSRTAPEIAAVMGNVIRGRGNHQPGFYFFRTTWTDPTEIRRAMELVGKQKDLNAEFVDVHTFFSLFKQSLEK
jgi:hypothetical protein